MIFNELKPLNQRLNADWLLARQKYRHNRFKVSSKGQG